MVMMSFVDFRLNNVPIGSVRIDSYIGMSQEEILEKAFALSKTYFQDNNKTVQPQDNDTIHFDIDTIFVKENRKTGIFSLIDRIKYSIINWSLFNCFLCKIFLTPKLYKPEWWKYNVGNFFTNDAVTRDQVSRIFNLISMCSTEGVCDINYTNYLGQRRWRTITLRWCPLFTSDKHHSTPQWLLNVYAHDRDDKRTIAMTDIHGWRKPV